jgi:predicted RND superfamily exporter protein
MNQVYLPYKREALVKCREEYKKSLFHPELNNFEYMMNAFPRRIVFITNGSNVNGILLRINVNRTFIDYHMRDFYQEIGKFHRENIHNATDGFKNSWFINVDFELYNLKNQPVNGIFLSVGISMLIAFITILVISGNICITVNAFITISFTIVNAIAIFVLMGWSLNGIESVVITMSVGFSMLFSCHYAIVYANGDFSNENTASTNLNSIELNPSTVANLEEANATGVALPKVCVNFFNTIGINC